MEGHTLPDSVVTRVYRLCRLVADIADGIVPDSRIVGEEVGAAARAFIAAIDQTDGPEREDRPRKPEQLRRGESRERHIERVVREHAEPAFWAHVVRAFPHVETGDFGPEDVSALQNAMEHAIEDWLHANEKLQPTTDQMAAFGTLMHEASIGAFGITQTVQGFLARDATETVPSLMQAGGPVDPGDFVVVVGCEDDENADAPGTARTIVTIIPPSGSRGRTYEVQ